MPTIVNELKYLREAAEFHCCILEAISPVYDMARLDALIKEYNQEIEALIKVDSEERHKLVEGGQIGCFKSRNGLAQNYFVYLMASEEAAMYPFPIFHSYMNEYTLTVNEEMKGRDIGKLGIFLCWLAMKDAWDCLKVAIEQLEPPTQTASSASQKQYHAPVDCAKWEGSVYEKGIWAPADIALTISGPVLTLTLGDYIKGDPNLQQLLRNNGGVKAGAHLIPDYIVNERLSGNISSKVFRDVATQVSAYLDSLQVQVPNFESICKLMGINE